MSEMCAEFSSATTSINEYEIRGKNYIVTSHYAGEKDMGQVIYAWQPTALNGSWA